MVAKPRSEVVRQGEVDVYHCHSRCVRQAFLTGFDALTNTDYSYRREWIVEAEAKLAELFGFDIGFHAELSNHYHLVIRSRPDVVEDWSDEEVVRRCLTLNLIKRNARIDGHAVSEKRIAATLRDPDKVRKFRERLSSVSWFMGCLNEYIGRRANSEDGRTGCFFDNRFSCRRLEDETSLLICGIYVDLNQIRAGEAVTPEESRNTSAFDRIKARSQSTSTEDDLPLDRWLAPRSIMEGPNVNVRDQLHSKTPWRASDKGLLPVSLDRYLDLLDWTGRKITGKNKGVIPSHLAPILERLAIPSDHLAGIVIAFEDLSSGVVNWGTPSRQLRNAINAACATPN